jgi:hypothetical protein
VEEAKEQARSDRADKVKVSARTSTYLVFFDFYKMFDQVPRQILLQKLARHKLPQQLVNVYHDLLSSTKATVGDDSFGITVGIVQGSISSPQLFSLFTTDLLDLYNEKEIESRMFADDICCVVKGEAELKRVIDLTEEWCTNNEVRINKKKSAIMAVRQDRRTPLPKIEECRGIAVVTHYKYLGITLDDCCNFGPAIKEAKKKESNFKRLVSLTWAQSLSGQTRYVVWQALIKSRFMYGVMLLLNYNDKIKEWHKSLMYRLLKALFRIRVNPAKDTLLETMLGTPFGPYQDLMAKAQMVKLKPAEARTPEEKRPLDEWFELDLQVKEHLKRLIYADAYTLVKFKLSILFTGWKQGRRREKHYCSCKQQLTQVHACTCPKLKKLWDYDPLTLLDRIKRKWFIMTKNLTVQYTMILESIYRAIIKVGITRQTTHNSFLGINQ